jgi:hypothetical protein
MKTYFLALRNEDFTVSGNTWKSPAIDLYSNKFYTNYSVLKSSYGNNVIDDYTFTGLETKNNATPSLGNTYAVTDYGEVVLDSDYGQYYVYEFDEEDNQFYYYLLDENSTPNKILNPSYFDSLQRFVDTSSAINIVGFKHSFTSLPGSENPKFNLKITSNEDNSEIETDWRQILSVPENVNVLFLKDVNRYCKFEINFSSESSLENMLFLLLVQVDIENISIPVISDHTRNILSRFPGWTKIYADSLQKATPEIAVPDTLAGSFFNSLVADGLDDIDSLMTRVDLDSFISSANVNQLSWIYLSFPVSPGFIKVRGDGIELARVSRYSELLQYTAEDYVFYYNYLTSELFTIKQYGTLHVDSLKVEQIPVQSFNSFDELGLRVGLQRLFLEENDRFKQRILDVYINPPDITLDGFKRTLRRELDIWKAYGSTPNSFEPGSTPDVLEISDLLKNEKYFDQEGNPKDSFHELVESLNKSFPSNYGYIKWNEAYWDYAGIENEGITRIPQVADATPLYDDEYQYGIGDFEDAKLILEKLDLGIKKYSFSLRAHGYKYDETKDDNYEPIRIAYDTYVSYLEQYNDHEEATITYDIYLKLMQHGKISANSTFKATKTDYIKNYYDQTSSSSPEYLVKELFTASGLTSSDYSFVSLDAAATPYRNTIEPSATESYLISQIPLFSVQEASISYVSSKNSLGEIGDYGWVSFIAGPIANASNQNIVKQFNDASYSDSKLKINSNIFNNKKTKITNTPKVRNYGEYTIVNYPTVGYETSQIELLPSEIMKHFSISPSVLPQYFHIDNIVVDSFTLSPGLDIENFYGGVSFNRDLNENVYIGSSPNIYISFIEPNFATPQMHESYVGTEGSTVNYYFTNAKFPYQSTPNSIIIRSNDGDHYPFKYPLWEKFSSDSIQDYEFYLSENGVVQASPNINQELLDSKNSDVINWFNFNRSEFGLEEYSSSDNLYFTSIEVLNESDDVEIWTDYTFNTQETIINTDILDDNTSLNSFNEENEIYSIKNLPIRAKYLTNSTKYISPSLRSGWYYQDEHRFIYAKPKTETILDNEEIVLSQLSRKGSPILVSTIESSGATAEYYQVAFHEESTPSIYSYYNYEYIEAKDEFTLYLSYENVFDLEIQDTFTGKIVSSNLQYETNKVSIVSMGAEPVFVIGRIYKVKYRVLQTFNVDNQYFYELDNSYRTKVTLLSTPNSSYTTRVTYESSFYDDDYELPEMKLNPLYSSLDEGFIYLSHNEYEYDSYDVSVSPKQILADNEDFMVLNIFSKDINSNPKPYIEYQIFGENISATPSFVTTDVEGHASAIIKYFGPNVPYEELNTFNVIDQDNVSATIDYIVKPDYYGRDTIRAEVDKKIVVADGISVVNVIGKTNPNVNIYWRKSRNLADLFDIQYSTNESIPGQNNKSGRIVSKSSGLFGVGPFLAQGDATPGYWFVSLETDLVSSSSSTPSIVSGDIVYWYEKYDSLQSELDEPIYFPKANFDGLKGHYSDNKAIKVNSLTEKAYYTASATPTWSLPDWYPISKYTQYQMGLLGATPYVIEYSDIHPDYEEE